MSLIRFKYLGNDVFLKTSKNFSYEILKEFSEKINVNIDDLFFLYKGKYLSTKEKDKQNISKIFKNNGMISAFNIKNIKIKKESNFILCPVCKNFAIISNNENKINIDSCRKNHNYKHLTIEQFINSQYNNKPILKCNKCKNNMNLNKKDYYVCACEKIFCSECINEHINKTNHKMINYKESFYKCAKHSNIFISYCNTCKLNLCIICENEHNALSHKITLFKKIQLNQKKLNEINENLNEFKENIKQYEIELKTMKELFEKIMLEALKNLQNYKKLYNQLRFTYNNINNYESYQNMNYLNIKKLQENLNTFLNYSIGNKFKYLIDSYKFLENQLILVIHNKEKKDKIKIFSEEFVKNNKDNCYILINNTISEFNEFYLDKEKKERKMLKINLIKDKLNIKSMFKDCGNLVEIKEMSNLNIDEITDLSFMFHCCSSLVSIPDISNWIIANTSKMNNMFYGCSSLKYLPDISKWMTLSLTDISYMFYGCSSLTYLPDISKWNTYKIKNMNNIFSHCTSLSTLPEISTWNTTNVKDMNNMFSFCKSLINIPDISKWNTKNVKDMNCMFQNCINLQFLPDISLWNLENLLFLNGIFSYFKELLSIPDISKWNVSKVVNMNGIFCGCKSLKYLPDISMWKLNKTTNMNGMFCKCESLLSLPDISKWNTSTVYYMSNLFCWCKSLVSLPDISNWDTSNVTDMTNMFSNCISLSSLPDLSKWKINDNLKYKDIFSNCKKSLNIPSKFKNYS